MKRPPQHREFPMDHLYVGFLGLLILFCLKFLFSSVWLPSSHRVGAQYYRDKRRFLITGAASGTGRYLTKSLLSKGHKVLATDKEFRLLKQVSIQDGWMHFEYLEIKPLDISNSTDWESASRHIENRFGGCDVMVNCSCSNKIAPTLQSLDEEEVDSGFDMDIKGVVLGTSAISKLMIRQQRELKLPHGGHLIFFTPASGSNSILASLTPSYVEIFCSRVRKDLYTSGVYVTYVDFENDMGELVESQSKLLETLFFDQVLPQRKGKYFVGSTSLRRLNDFLSWFLDNTRFNYYFMKKEKLA